MHSHSGEMLDICTPIQERCSSGLRGTPGKRVYDKIVSRVRIPISPQRKKRLHSFGMRLFFAPSASSSLAKPEAWKSHDMLRISAVLSQPFLLVARAPRRALRECAALQGEHNPDEGAWRVLRLQARLQSRRCGKAMICSAYQPFCPSRSSLLQGPPRRAVRECAALQGEHNPDERARLVLRLQARLQSRRCGMRRKNGNLSCNFPPHSHLVSFGIIDNQ